MQLANNPASKKKKDLSLLGSLAISSIITIILTANFTKGVDLKCVDLLYWANWYLYYSIFTLITAVMWFFIVKFSNYDEGNENGKCVATSTTVYLVEV